MVECTMDHRKRPVETLCIEVPIQIPVDVVKLFLDRPTWEHS